jgi:hypothetical protein
MIINPLHVGQSGCNAVIERVMRAPKEQGIYRH